MNNIVLTPKKNGGYIVTSGFKQLHSFAEGQLPLTATIRENGTETEVKIIGHKIIRQEEPEWLK